MQTFLPYADFRKSAEALDRQRLGKQRVENLQIMQALTVGSRWQNHPAVRMWRGYTCALMSYQHAICAEWTSRGYKDTCLEKTMDVHGHSCDLSNIILPTWVGVEEFHASHRSNLLRKNSYHYAHFDWTEPENLPYIWPVSSDK